MHSTIQSPKKKREVKKRTKVLLVAVVLVAGLLFWGTVKIFSLPVLQIKGVTVRGAKLLSPSEVRQKAEAELHGNYFYFFPKRNTLLYPKAKIETDILADFPTASSIVLDIGDASDLVLTITEREPIAIWCGQEKPSADVVLNPACFYVDKSGFIFGTSPSFSGDAYFTLYGAGSIKDGNAIGQYLVRPEIFKKILDLREFLLKNRISANSLYFGADGYAEFFEPTGFMVKWNADQDIDSLELNMRAIFRESLWRDGIFSSDLEKKAKPLEYIDFRFGNKVFYRQKGETPVVPVVTGTSTPSEAPTVEPTT